MEIKKIIEEMKDFSKNYANISEYIYSLDLDKVEILLGYINNLEQQLKKKDEVIEKIKITLKEQAIKIPTRIDVMTCEMKYTDKVVKVNQLLRILEDKEVE